MRNSWLAYVAVATISAIVAVAIAGTPTALRTDPTISIPETVATTTAVTTSTTVAAVEPVQETTTTSSVPETSTTVLTTTTTLPPVDRAEIAVVAVNGASISGIATRVRNQLQDLGYDRARPTDGSTIVEETVVYFFPGFEREAETVALDLDLDSSRTLPVADAPEFGALNGDQVAVYLGRDRR